MSQSTNWKLGIFGIVSLMLIMGLFSNSAIAASAAIGSGGVTPAGSTINTVTINVTGLPDGGSTVTVHPPKRWSPMVFGAANNATPGYTTAGSLLPSASATPDNTKFEDGVQITVPNGTTSISVRYGDPSVNQSARAAASPLIERGDFRVRVDTDSAILLPAFTIADGSGRIEITSPRPSPDNRPPNETEAVSGETRNFLFKYFAPGEGTEAFEDLNSGKFNGGELVLTIPTGWVEPQRSDSSAPGFIQVDDVKENGTVVTDIDQGNISISGRRVSVPINSMIDSNVAEAARDFHFTVQYKNVSVPVATGTSVFQSQVRGPGGVLRPLQTDRTPTIAVISAPAGSGRINVTGGPVPAGSEGNTLTFTFTADGTMDAGGVEIDPPAGWPDPSGGNINVSFPKGGNASNITFTGEKFGDVDFDDKTIGIKLGTLRKDQEIQIVYGPVTAQSNEGTAVFDVRTIGNNAALQPFTGTPPFVSVQSGDGSGDASVDISNFGAAVNAGEKGTLKFIFEAEGTMDGGAIELRVPTSATNGWPSPTSGNIEISSATGETTGVPGAPTFLGRSVTFPIDFISQGQKITINYKDVVAPITPEDSKFVIASRGTPGGQLEQVEELEVKVEQAADGSGTATVSASPSSTIFAGSKGNTLKFTYTAVGKMDGGGVRFHIRGGANTPSDDWGDLTLTGSVGKVSIDSETTASVGTLSVSSDSRFVEVPINSMAGRQKIVLRYENATAQSTTGVASTKDGTELKFKVESKGSGDSARIFADLHTDNRPKYKVQNVADGSGEISNISVESNLPNDLTVPAAHATNRISFTYKAVGQMDKGSVRLTVPTGWSHPQGSASLKGHLDVVSGNGNPTIGTTTFSGRVATINLTQMRKDDTIVIHYGGTSDGSKAVSPDVAGSAPFEFKSRGFDDGRSFQTAATPPITVKNVLSGPESGSVSDVSPDAVIADTPNATFSVKFTANGTMSGGAIKLEVPAGWTKPGNAGQAGFTVAEVIGNTTITDTVIPPNPADRSVTVKIGTMQKGDALRIVYGKGGGSSGVKVQSQQGTGTFILSSDSDGADSGGTFNFVEVGRKTVTVNQLAGTGQMTVTPDIARVRVTPGTPDPRVPTTYRFVYKAEAAISNGQLQLAVPPGWTNPTHDTTITPVRVAPPNDPNDFIDTSLVTVSPNFPIQTSQGGKIIGGGTINISQINLPKDGQMTITFSSVKSPLITSPAPDFSDGIQGNEVVSDVFEFETRFGGVRLRGDKQPVIWVVPHDGSGDFTSNTSSPTVLKASDKGTLTFVYQSDGVIKDGALTLRTPVGWSLPSTSGVGKVTASVPDAVVTANSPNPPPQDKDNNPLKNKLDTVTVSGDIATIPITRLGAGQTVTIVYGAESDKKAVIQNTALQNVGFGVSSRTSAGGSPVGVEKDNNVVTFNVNNAPNGSGTGAISVGPVRAGSDDNTITITYTASGTMSGPTPSVGGAVRITLPSGLHNDDAGWTPPQDTTSDGDGFVDVSTTGALDPSNPLDIIGSPAIGFQANILSLAPNQRITFRYNKAKVQGKVRNTDDNSLRQIGDSSKKITGTAFLIESRGGSVSADYPDFQTVVPATTGNLLPPSASTPHRVGTGVADDTGILRLPVDFAADGSGSVVANIDKIEFDVNRSDNNARVIHAGSKNNEIQFVYTASGPIKDGLLRLRVPSGWSNPQGTSTASPGFSQASSPGSIGTPGVPTSATYTGNTTTIPIRNLAANQTVTISYGQGGGDAGVVAPATAGKSTFVFEVQGASTGNLISIETNPEIDVKEAFDGTGHVFVNNRTVNAGSKNTMVFTYRALGTIKDGSLALTIPPSWTPILPETDVKDVVSVSSTGSVKDPIRDPNFDRRVIVDVNSLAPRDTVTLTYKDAVAQPNKQDNVKFFFEVLGASQVRTNFRSGNDLADPTVLPSNPVTLLRHEAHRPIKVDQAAPGSGSGLVDLSAVRTGTSDNLLKLTYTAVGTISETQEIHLTIPNKWTTPNDDDFAADDNPTNLDKEGRWKIELFEASQTTPTDSLTAKNQVGTKLVKKPVSGRNLVARTKEDQSIEAGDRIIFTYITNSPGAADQGLYPFVFRSRGTAISNSPSVTASPSGNGSGAMTVDTDSSDSDLDNSVVGASEGNNLKFTYTAVQDIVDGAISITVPQGWTAPQEDSTKKGYVLPPVAQDFNGNPPVNANVQNAQFSGNTLTIPIAGTFPAKGSISIEYKDVSVQKAAGPAVFESKSQVSSGGTLQSLIQSPTVTVQNIRNGSGKMVVTGGPVPAQSTGNQLKFTFTSEGTMDGGLVELNVPTGWSPPQGASGTEGYTTVDSQGTPGNLDFSGQKLTIPIQTLAPDRTITINYGALSGSSGARAQSNVGDASFVVKTKGSASGDPADIADFPVVSVTNVLDGTGKVSVSTVPANITAGGNVDITFTFEPDGTMNGGAFSIDVPPSWSPPKREAGDGQTTVTEVTSGAVPGTLSVSGQTFTVPIIQATNGEQIKVKYSGKAQQQVGTARFVAKSKGSASGTLSEILTARIEFSVGTAGDGSGIATATPTPDPIRAGSSGNKVKITYAAVGPIRDGGVKLQVPSGWSLPQDTDQAKPGFFTVNSTGSVGEITSSGQSIEVDIDSISANQTITIDYGSGVAGTVAQGTAGGASFIVESKGSATGSFKALVAGSPTVTVGNAKDGSGSVVASRASVIQGSTDNQISFTFTSIGTMGTGAIRLVIPSSWTTPQGVPRQAGYTTVSAGSASTQIQTASFSGQLVVVPITKMGPNETIQIVYGDLQSGGSGSGVTVGSTAQFLVESQGNSQGSLLPLATGSPTIQVGLAADKLAISSAPQTIFKDQASGPIKIETRLASDDSPATTTNGVSVNLSSNSATGTFATSADGPFNPSPTPVSIPAGSTSIDVFYKDSAVGTPTLTATAPSFPATTRTATQGITISEGATQLGLSSADSFFAGDPLEVTVQTLDSSGNPAVSSGDVTVSLSSNSSTGSFEDSGGTVVSSVTIPQRETQAKVTYKDTTFDQTATLTASATGLTDGTQSVTVDNTVSDITVSGSPVKTGDTVTITAIGKPGTTPANFSINTTPPVDKQTLTESNGTYTGSFTPTSAHSDGTYDVVVNIGTGSKTLDDGLTIDNTAPVLTDASTDKSTVKNGQSFNLSVKSESGLTVEADVSSLDTTQNLIPLTDPDGDGTYSADITVSPDNTAPNGSKSLSITGTDTAGNVSQPVTATINLQNGAAFDLEIPKGISLIHVPLKVSKVDGTAAELKSVGDVFDALGTNVNFLISYDSSANAKAWRSYLGGGSKGKAADQTLTDDFGIIAVMKQAKTLRLEGEALGTDGKSAINITRGTNLVGVPIKDSRINVVSDLLTLDGIKGNAGAIVVNDGGEFKVVAQKGDPGDIAVTGGQSFIVTASAAGKADITGDAWDNVSGSTSGAPPVALAGIQVDGATPVMAIHGAVIDEVTKATKDGFTVTVKNLTRGTTVNSVSGQEGEQGSYNMTFVDTKSGRAISVGDVLEVSVESPNPLIGVQPLRHVVTTDDVNSSQLRFADLVAYEIPAQTELLLNYPNPFNPETWIPYRLAKDAAVNLTIYDMTGKVVRDIRVGFKPAAVYESKDKAIYWDGRNDFGERVASGIYFYTLTASDYSATRKMLILK